MKILIMGLPGAGKTWLAERLQKLLPECAWYNADTTRKIADDWDFSLEGRIRQAKRMKTFAEFEVSQGRKVICDFVCPTEDTREAFGPDITIWVDTLDSGRFEDTNKLFEQPTDVDFRVVRYLVEEDGEVEKLAQGILSKSIYDDGILTGC